MLITRAFFKVFNSRAKTRALFKAIGSWSKWVWSCWMGGANTLSARGILGLDVVVCFCGKF